jgi:hypothetical protein
MILSEVVSHVVTLPAAGFQGSVVFVCGYGAADDSAKRMLKIMTRYMLIDEYAGFKVSNSQSIELRAVASYDHNLEADRKSIKLNEVAHYGT